MRWGAGRKGTGPPSHAFQNSVEQHREEIVCLHQNRKIQKSKETLKMDTSIRSESPPFPTPHPAGPSGLELKASLERGVGPSRARAHARQTAFPAQSFVRGVIKQMPQRGASGLVPGSPPHLLSQFFSWNLGYVLCETGTLPPS